MSDQLSGKKGSSYPVVDEEFSEADRVSFLKSTRIHAVGMKAGSKEFTDGNLTLNDLKTDQVQANWDEVDDTKPSYIQNKPTIPSLEGYATEDYVESQVSGKQDTISDLDAIREGAVAGATAVQPSDLETTLQSYAQLSDITVSGVTVDGVSVVNAEGVAEIPAIPMIQGSSTIDYIPGSGGKLSVKVPVPAPKEDQSDRGKVLTVNDSDQVVWGQPSSSIEISQYNGDVSTVSTVNDSSSGGYIFNLNIDSETLEEYHDDAASKKYVTVKNPLPSAEDASEGDVLTITSGQVGWAPSQGGGGGGNPYTKVSVTPGDCYPNGQQSSYGFDLYDQDVTISNNTYSVLPSPIGYYPAWEDEQGDYHPSHNLDNLVIKLPNDTAFPMAVVEFTVQDSDDYYLQGCVNNVKVKIGETELTRMYSAPYNPNTLLLGGEHHDQFEYWKLVTIPNEGNPYYRIEQIHNEYRGADISAFVHGTKVQVQIFGSCFNVTMSQACGEPSAS